MPPASLSTSAKAGSLSRPTRPLPPRETFSSLLSILDPTPSLKAPLRRPANPWLGVSILACTSFSLPALYFPERLRLWASFRLSTGTFSVTVNDVSLFWSWLEFSDVLARRPTPFGSTAQWPLTALPEWCLRSMLPLPGIPSPL